MIFDCGDGSGLRRRIAVPRYCRVAACVVAGDARVDRRTAVAHGGEAALDIERCVRR